MEIETRKRNFLDFLRNCYQAGMVEGGAADVLRVPQDVLARNGFGNQDKDFWTIICPALRGEGYLRDFSYDFIANDRPMATFVISEDKLFVGARDKKQVAFDGGRLITYRDSRHAFQAARGQRGLPLEFFKLLWSNRLESRRGVQTRKGDRKEASYYSVQLNLANDVRSYHDGIGKQGIANLVKTLNRAFASKKFPMQINNKGGLLLEVSNP